MTIWLTAEIALLVAMLLCGVSIFRGRRVVELFVSMQLAGVLAVLALMILAEAMHRPSFYDLSLALALLSFPGALVFSHFVEMWLR